MVVDADVSQIPVGVNGEALVLDAPVRCTVQPAALRVKVAPVPVPDPKLLMDWKRLRNAQLTVIAAR